jgi:hypothetical protein
MGLLLLFTPESFPTAKAIVNNNNTSVTNIGGGVYRIEKTGASGLWDGGAVSSASISGDFVLRIDPLSVFTEFVIGVSANPTVDDDWDTISFAVDHHWSLGWDIYETGVQQGGGYVAPAGRWIWMWRTSGTIGYGSADTLTAAQASPRRTVANSSALYFDSSMQVLGETARVVFYEIVSAQTLSSSLFTNTQTFHAQTVSPGAVALAPALVTNTQTFYASTVGRGAVTLSPSPFTNSQTFHAATVVPGAVSLAPSLLTNTQTFYGQTITPGAATLAPALFTNSQTFHSSTIAPGAVSLSSSLFTNTQTFYASTLAPGALTLTPALFTNNQTFHAATITVGAVSLASSLFTNSQTFYSSTVSNAGGTTQDLTPALFTNSQTFYGSTVAPGAVTLQPGLLTNSQTFFETVLIQLPPRRRFVIRAGDQERGGGSRRSYRSQEVRLSRSSGGNRSYSSRRGR